MTRLKDILNERNLTLKQFAAMLDITYTALYYQLDKPSYPTLVKWSQALNVPLWQLFASPDEVQQCKSDEVCASVRFIAHDKKYVHLHADTWAEFWAMVDEVAGTHPRPRKQP